MLLRLFIIFLVYNLWCAGTIYIYVLLSYYIQCAKIQTIDTMLSSEHHFPRQREDGQDKVYNVCKLE